MAQIEGRFYPNPQNQTVYIAVPIACDRDGKIFTNGGTSTSSTLAKSLVVNNEQITVGGTAQIAATFKANRNYLLIQNNSPGDLWVNFDAAAGVDLGMKLAPGETRTFASINNQVSIFGSTTGQKYAIGEV